MKHKNRLNRSDGFSLIELMVVAAILSLLAAIAIPNYISYRNKSFCSLAETDADHISRAITDYFSIPSHSNLPLPTDLNIKTNNPFVITGDPNDTIVIAVTDKSGRCPQAYQQQYKNWDPTTKTYTIKIQ